MKVPFCLPLIDKEVELEMMSCLLETGWLTTGPKVAELEREITKLSETNCTICVNSWTSGMLLMIKWLELDENDEVIIPTYTYAATALAVINSNVKCVYVDVNDDFTASVLEISKAITENTKVILPVDIGGMPFDYLALQDLLNSEGVKRKFMPKTDFQKRIGRPIIIADSAHSIGSLINEKPTPLFSDFSIYSFHSVKNITTGEGGAITFRIFNQEEDNEILNDLRLLSLNGQNKSAFDKNALGGWKYDIKTNGLKVNMPDVNAAIGLAQIRKYKTQLLPERESIFNKYNELLSRNTWAILPQLIIDNRKSSCHLYQLRIDGFEENQRDELISRLSALEIGVNVHYIPIPMMSYFKGLRLDILDFPMSYKLFKNEISLPIYNNLSLDKIEHVCLKLKEIVDEIFYCE